jgi:hypothetical protein
MPIANFVPIYWSETAGDVKIAELRNGFRYTIFARAVLLAMILPKI